MNGRPSGPPEWPYPGGLLNQPARLVDAVDLLRQEWLYLPRPKPATKKPVEAPKFKRARRHR